ncbi:MAG: DUF3048 domain-containing protein [Bacillus sp. (in: Bacteria)]|nr:DUF3048 domain-containing protein [Bacillus sp. (in: firmicutes)]
MTKLAVAVTAFLLLLSGCSDKETVKEPVKKVETVTNPEIKEDPYFYPLTGIGSETRTDGRAVAVMVNNHPLARPQSGLNKADIVYEVIAEGDVTRFLAVFQSEQPVNIGPVRSARAYYIDLAEGLDALYIAHGYSEEARIMLESNQIDNINGMVYDGTLFKRSSSRKAPHNSYITYENILEGVNQKKYSMEKGPAAFTFLSEEDSKTIAGNVANSVSISYSKSGKYDSTYEFDDTLGKYKRFSDGEQTVDLETNEPILLDNIFIIETTHQVIDDAGHNKIDFKSGGKGYLLQKGKINEVDWKNNNGRIVPVKDGVEVPFVQGRTWVNVMPTKLGLQNSISFNEQ